MGSSAFSSNAQPVAPKDLSILTKWEKTKNFFFRAFHSGKAIARKSGDELKENSEGYVPQERKLVVLCHRLCRLGRYEQPLEALYFLLKQGRVEALAVADVLFSYGQKGKLVELANFMQAEGNDKEKAAAGVLLLRIQEREEAAAPKKAGNTAEKGLEDLGKYYEDVHRQGGFFRYFFSH